MIMARKYRNAMWAKVHVSLAVIELTICLGCLCFAVYHQRTHRNLNSTNRRDQKMSISKCIPHLIYLGLISFCISSISQPIHFWLFNTSQNLSTDYCISIVATWFTWSLGQLCSYLVFLLRLVNTFAHSAHYLSKSTIVYSLVLLILYEIAWILNCISPFVFWEYPLNHTDYFHTKQGQFQYYITIPIFILDLVITISMIYMFVSRLVLVMREQAEAGLDRHLRMDALDKSLNANGTNHKLMGLCVKIAVLSITGLLSSLIFVILQAINVHFDLNGCMALITHFWLQADTVISCFCLTLFVAQTERFYRILCCCCIAVGYQWTKRALMIRRDRSESSFRSRSITSDGLSSKLSNAGNASSDPFLVMSESGQIL